MQLSKGRLPPLKLVPPPLARYFILYLLQILTIAYISVAEFGNTSAKALPLEFSR